jgi:hypothetical protein
MEDQMRQGTYWLGVFFGAVTMLLIGLIIDRLNDKPPSSYVDMPKDIVQAYNMGLKDAIRTNPPSMELEQTCVNLWADKQPVR